MRYNKINPFSVVSREEIQQADEQEMGKHAISKAASMEPKDVEGNQPMSSADVKEAWRNYREAKKVQKESRLKQ